MVSDGYMSSSSHGMISSEKLKLYSIYHHLCELWIQLACLRIVL